MSDGTFEANNDQPKLDIRTMVTTHILQVASPDNSGSLIRLGTAAGHLNPAGSGGLGLVGSSRRHHSGGAGSGQSELGILFQGF